MEKGKAARLKAEIAHFEDCKQAYRSMKAEPSGFYIGKSVVKDTEEDLSYTVESEVKDTEEDSGAEEDEDGDAVMEDVGQEAEEIHLPTLHLGSYVMDPTTLECLIYKVDSTDEETFKIFHHLEAVRHPALIRHHTFYEETLGRSAVPRIVLSGVYSTFWNLIKKVLKPDQASKMFFRLEKSGASLKKELITMILDLCSGLEHLFKLGLYPPKIDFFDLYVCKDGPKRYRLQLLALKVEKLTTESDQNSRKAKLWTEVKQIVTAIREYTKTKELSEVDKRFINYIGKDVSMLAQYPLSWSYDQKGRYLISIISAKKSIICKKLQNSGLQWAKHEKTVDSPKLIKLLIENDKKRVHPANYSTAVPYDYILLCRTTYKHHPTLCNEVKELKDMCPNRDDFLEKMEKWEPLIWCILYDAIGLIASL